MSFKKQVQAFANAVLTYGFLPYAVFLAARAAFPLADLRGPYLFVSPLLAISVAGIVFVHRIKWERLPLSEKVQETVIRVGDRIHAGREATNDWFLQPNNRIGCPLPGGSYLTVDIQDWAKASTDALEFAIARTLVQREMKPMSWLVSTLNHAATLVPGMFVCSMNLWAILPTHSIMLVGGIATSIWKSERKERELDGAALRRTRKFTGAIQYLAQVTESPWHTSDKRLRHLQAVAAELGLR